VPRIVALRLHEGRDDGPLAIQYARADETLGHAEFFELFEQGLQAELSAEVALLDCEQWILGGADQIRRQGAAVLLGRGLQGVALVLGGEVRQPQARCDQERDHEGAEFDLE
jgi:hypothetical protein